MRRGGGSDAHEVAADVARRHSDGNTSHDAERAITRDRGGWIQQTSVNTNPSMHALTSALTGCGLHTFTFSLPYCMQ
jgi:hypothetical protein